MWFWRAGGPLEVRCDGVPISVTGRPRRLLAALLAGRGVALDPATLAERVWDEPPPGWAGAVRVTVNRLRAALGEGAPIFTSAAGYQLRTEPGTVDLWEFERLVDVDSGSAPERVARQLESALELWHGVPFQEYRDMAWVAPVASHLEELERQATERWALASLDLGRHQEIVPALEAAVAHEPYRERRWWQLMLALYRSGRQADALRAFDAARCTLIDEMGVEPGRDLVELQTRILDHDPTLDLALPRTTVVRARRSQVALLGRETEQAQVESLLGRHRCVVVLGMGGIGKTRLAHAVARRLEDEHVLVELSPVTGRGQIPSALASALGLNDDGDPHQLLARAAAEVERRQAVVVLDACEHLADDLVGFAQTLFAASPHVRLLVTSRVPVQIPGAMSVVLGPLDMGTARQPGPAALIVADHAGIARSELSMRWREIERAGTIAGGVPLALELAGRALGRSSGGGAVDAGPDPVADAVRVAIDTLPSGLVPDVRRLARLPAGFTVPFAQRVWACEEREVRYHLDGLTHRGLVSTDHRTSPARTRFLDPVRESLLVSDDPSAGASDRRRLTGVVGVIARDAVGRWRQPFDHSLAGLLDDEHRNVQTIIASPDLAPGQLGAIATSLVLCWRNCGRVVEARDLAERALAGNAGTEDDRLWAELLLTRVLASRSFAERLVHLDDLTTVRDTAARLGDRELELRAMIELAQAYGWAGAYGDADALLGELTTELAGQEDSWAASAVRRMRAVLTGVSTDVECGVRQLLVEADAFVDSYPDYAVSTLFLAANLLRIAGDDDGARSILLRASEHPLDRFSAASHAKVALELARVSVSGRTPDAEFRLRRAAVLADQVGDTRSALVCRRDLGRWLHASGDRDEGVRLLTGVVAPLLVVDRLAAAVALAVLAGDPRFARHRCVLAGTAWRLHREASGSPLSPAERDQIEALGPAPPAQADDRAIVAIVTSVGFAAAGDLTPGRMRA
jgi:DNA-binding SARP family transcriptional activator